MKEKHMFLMRRPKTYLLVILLTIFIIPVGCHRAPVERGPVFGAVENTLAQNGLVIDDLIRRNLVEISGNGTAGVIKIGEIEQLIKDKVYIIDKDGYLQFGPDYVPPEPPREPYFPVQTEKPETYLAALLPGKLVIDKDGYLRVGNALILWPYGYSFSMEGADIWILDDKGVKVARVGNEVKIGGGFIPGDVVPMKIGHALPADCEGPFWLAAPMSEQNNSPIKTSLKNAGETLGIEIPWPHYLTEGYEIKSILVSGNTSVKLLISNDKDKLIELEMIWKPIGIIPYKIDLNSSTVKIDGNIAQIIESGDFKAGIVWNWYPERYKPGLIVFTLLAPRDYPISELVLIAESISWN